MNRRELARRAYEQGMMRRALPWAVPPALLAAIAAWTGSASAPIAGPLLVAAVVALRWRGGDLGRAAIAGLGAGAVPFVLMLCSTCWWACECYPGRCAAVGVGSGILGALVLARALRTRALPAASAGLGIAALTASMVCLSLGVPGLLVLPALIAAAPPVLVLQRS